MIDWLIHLLIPWYPLELVEFWALTYVFHKAFIIGKKITDT